MILQDLSEHKKKKMFLEKSMVKFKEKMRLIVDKISAKDTVNKDFLNGII